MKKADGALRRVNFLSWEDILCGKKPAGITRESRRLTIFRP